MKKKKFRVLGNVVVPNSTVETPPHIAKLMQALVGVNKDSVLYDPCAGRGNLIKDAGCQTIAVEQESQFKPDLDKVADIVIIDSCFNVDTDRLSNEVLTHQLLNLPLVAYTNFIAENIDNYPIEELTLIIEKHMEQFKNVNSVEYYHNRIKLIVLQDIKAATKKPA